MKKNIKRINNLYEKICNKDNIEYAIYKSSKGKRKRNDVIRVLKNVDYYVDIIHDMLINKTYVFKSNRSFDIYDSLNKKERIIYSPKYFPDQIIHYCLMNVLEPILLKKMYLYSCGSIPGRGTSFGHKNIKKWLKNTTETKYCLKLDIRKFYPSVNREILYNKFERIIKDKDTLLLISKIIDVDCSGLPIGFYTSGWFANLYLTDLDNFIKEELNIKYYLRYVDDLVLFSSNKRKLQKSIRLITEYLKKDKLIVKKNYQVFNIDYRDIDFLGYRFFRNKTILRKRIMLRISKRARKIYKKGATVKDASAILSYYGWIKHSDSYNFYRNYIKKYVKINDMKKIVSESMKKN